MRSVVEHKQSINFCVPRGHLNTRLLLILDEIHKTRSGGYLKCYENKFEAQRGIYSDPAAER